MELRQKFAFPFILKRTKSKQRTKTLELYWVVEVWIPDSWSKLGVKGSAYIEFDGRINSGIKEIKL
jgi:hypothetical protein